MRLRHVAALLVAIMVWTVLTVKVMGKLDANAAAVREQAAALNRLAAAQEAQTELTRRYYHALEDYEDAENGGNK